jgi:flagellar biosynthesis protein FliR
MALRVDIGWLIATGLVSVRVAAAIALAPVLGPATIPALVRVFLAVGLGVGLVAAVPSTLAAASLASPAALAIAAAGELVIGAAMAFGFFVAYAATQIAGRALDIQIGFGAAAVINPTTQAPMPLLGSVIGMVAVFIFLAMDGHHVLMRALALSLATMPPGTFPFSLDWSALFAHSGLMFVYGLALAAPVMFVLFLIDVAMAVMARSMPQLNVFVLSFSVKIVVGLMLLAATIRLAEPLFTALFEKTFAYWERMSAPL